MMEKEKALNYQRHMKLSCRRCEVSCERFTRYGPQGKASIQAILDWSTVGVIVAMKQMHGIDTRIGNQIDHYYFP